MRSLSLAVPKERIESALDEVLAIDPTVVLLFAAPSILRDPASRQILCNKLQGKTCIGCSTAGEIDNQGLHADTLAMLAIHFDQVIVRPVHCEAADNLSSFDAGETLGKALKGDDLKFVFVLGPGINLNGSAMLEGITSVLGQGLMIGGGLAGDGENFKQTHTFCAGKVFDNHVVAVGFYGDALQVGCGSEGGWRPFGPARRVTKTEHNYLYELDGKPALQLYKQYLGEKAAQLPASGLSYPFAVLRDDRTTSGVIRSALGIDTEKEALIMAGEVPQGCRVCLMHADTGALTQGAAQAAAEALRTHGPGEENGCAILVDCVGRRLVYGLDADEELDAVLDTFLPGTPMCGFYSYGEICTYRGTSRVEFHNQTMTISYLTERAVE